MAKIVDPDQLNQGTEVVFLSGERHVQLLVAGNLDDTSPGKTSGATMQAVYSFGKEEWMTDENLNKFKFPLKAITAFKFEWQYEWGPKDQQTRDLIRDGGWREVGITGKAGEFPCLVTLGDFHADTDQAYYQKVTGFDQTTTNFDKTGEVNEAYQSFSGEDDYRDFLKMFLRIEGKSYSEGNLIVDQGWASVDYDTYRIPLFNELDPNISASDATIDGNPPYTSMTIDYLKGRTFKAWDGSALSGEVTQNGGRWYYADVDTSNPPPHADHSSFSGEREIGGSWFAYNRIVSGYQGTLQEIYEFAQRSLRKTGDINDDVSGDGYGTVYGNVAKELVYFVGSTLVTRPGVFVDDYDINDQNDMEFYDITVDGGGLDFEDVPLTSTKRTFPFVAAGTMVFSDNLVSDPDAKYWMYYKSIPSGEFDTADAWLVQDNDGGIISGEVTQANITFDYDFTNNDEGGKTPDAAFDVVVVAMGLDDAEWISAEFTVTKTTGLNFPVNAADERNYSNP
jgi:hypothetical protein